MTPNDCILMMCVQLAETTSEREVARARVVELEQQVAQMQAATPPVADAGNGSGAVQEMQTVEAARG